MFVFVSHKQVVSIIHIFNSFCTFDRDLNVLRFCSYIVTQLLGTFNTLLCQVSLIYLGGETQIYIWQITEAISSDDCVRRIWRPGSYILWILIFVLRYWMFSGTISQFSEASVRTFTQWRPGGLFIPNTDPNTDTITYTSTHTNTGKSTATKNIESVSTKMYAAAFGGLAAYS